MVSVAPTAPAPAEESRLRWWIRNLLFHDLRGLLSIVYLALLLLTAILAPWLAPYSPIDQNLRDMTAEPSWQHLLGTDDLGRDVLSRLIYGAAPALYGSFMAVGIGVLLGVPVGLAAGFASGWVDSLLSRTIDALLSFPTIILAVGMTGILGGGVVNGMVAIGISFSPQFARVARSRALVIKHELYVEAARGFGASQWRLLARHVLPNAIQPVIVQVAMLLSIGLLAEASLSFLGLGVQPPQASWGGMLSRAYNYMEIVPAQMYAPGFAILVTALAFNGLGDTVRTLLDPKSRRSS